MNPALDGFREILDDRVLADETPYPAMADGMHAALKQGPLLPELGCTLGEALWAPIGLFSHLSRRPVGLYP